MAAHGRRCHRSGPAHADLDEVPVNSLAPLEWVDCDGRPWRVGNGSAQMFAEWPAASISLGKCPRRPGHGPRCAAGRKYRTAMSRL